MIVSYVITFLVGAAAGATAWAALVNPSRHQAIEDLHAANRKLADAMHRIYTITGHRPAAANQVTDPDNSRGLM